MQVIDEISIEELPEECIKACSHIGDCHADIEFWRKKLSFTLVFTLLVLFSLSPQHLVLWTHIR